MNWRTTAALFVILVALAGVVFWQSRQDDGSAQATPAAAAPTSVTTPLFPGATAADLQRLEIERAEDGAAVHFQRRDDGAWTQTVPTTTLVISQTLESAAATLLSANSRRTLAPDLNPLSAYGLDEPSATILFAVRRAGVDGAGQTVRHTLLVGNPSPAGNGYFAQKVGDRRVHILSTTAVDAILGLLDNPPHP